MDDKKGDTSGKRILIEKFFVMGIIIFTMLLLATYGYLHECRHYSDETIFSLKFLDPAIKTYTLPTNRWIWEDEETEKFYNVEEIRSTDQLRIEGESPQEMEYSFYNIKRLLSSSTLNLPKDFELRIGPSYKDDYGILLNSVEAYTLNDEGIEESVGWFYLPDGAAIYVYYSYYGLLIPVPVLDTESEIVDFAVVGIKSISSWKTPEFTIQDIQTEEKNNEIFLTVTFTNMEKNYYIFDSEVCLFYSSEIGAEKESPFYSFTLDIMRAPKTNFQISPKRVDIQMEIG